VLEQVLVGAPMPAAQAEARQVEPSLPPLASRVWPAWLARRAPLPVAHPVPLQVRQATTRVQQELRMYLDVRAVQARPW